MGTNNSLPFDLPGFIVDHVGEYPDRLIVHAHCIAVTARCPDCQSPSTSVHSYYTRSPRDLPSSDRRVQLVLGVRRFRCRNETCPRQTFAERLPLVVPVHAQRTVRLTRTLATIGYELSAEAGAQSHPPSQDGRER